MKVPVCVLARVFLLTRALCPVKTGAAALPTGIFGSFVFSRLA
jgi:hypothetical protein